MSAIDDARIRLSLHMMVLNGATVIERALRPLKGIVEEICFTDTGSTDGTAEKIIALAAELGWACQPVRISPMTHPRAYFVDEPATFRRKLEVPFSGSPLLRNWAWARNLSADFCDGQYVMKLDADDEVIYPENILPTLDHLDGSPEIQFLMAPYEIMDAARGVGSSVLTTEMYGRLWRNRLGRRFEHVMHEIIDGERTADGSNWLMVYDGLKFRDWRDSPGEGVRVPYRNLKTLLVEYERREEAGETIDGHLAFYLAKEGAEVLPELALKLLERPSTWTNPADRKQIHLMRGVALERLERPYDALEEYALSSSYGGDAGQESHPWRRLQALRSRLGSAR